MEMVEHPVLAGILSCLPACLILFIWARWSK